MPSMKHSHLLARVNFPLYTVRCLNDRFILVAGGGGGANTGIRNAIEVYQLINDGKTCRAEHVTNYETKSEAIMNCTVFNSGKNCILFTGQEGSCHVYRIQEVDAENEDARCNYGDEHASVTYRKNVSDCRSGTSKAKHPNLEIKHLESFQTDFSKEPYQKLVIFSRVENLLSTGGADGHIRLWTHSELKQIMDIKAHNDDLSDMDICPTGKIIASVSRDGHGRVWCTQDGSMINELECFLKAKSAVHYVSRNCRFGIIGDKNGLALFTTLNPKIRMKPPLECYLCKYETKNFSIVKAVSTGTDVLSAMAISDDGRFIGLGCQSGSIKIYRALNLQLLYNIENIHGISVTSVHFLPMTETSRKITGGHDTSLISVSVDNKIIIHHVPMKTSVSLLTPVTFLILTLFFVFVIADFNL